MNSFEDCMPLGTGRACSSQLHKCRRTPLWRHHPISSVYNTWLACESSLDGVAKDHLSLLFGNGTRWTLNIPQLTHASLQSGRQHVLKVPSYRQLHIKGIIQPCNPTRLKVVVGFGTLINWLGFVLFADRVELCEELPEVVQGSLQWHGWKNAIYNWEPFDVCLR